MFKNNFICNVCTNLDRMSFSNGVEAISAASIVVAASDSPEVSFALVSTVNVA